MNPVGHIDHVTRFHVIGWAADNDDLARPLKLLLFVNGEGCAEIEPILYRKDLEGIAPGATGHYAFRFDFPEPLLPYRHYKIEMKVEGTSFVLSREVLPVEPIMPVSVDEVFRPRGAILLVSIGRSGSTALMAILAQHPNVVISGNPPFEVELGCYYAHALRTLVAAADHERSLRAEHITAESNRYHIGFNPFLEPSYLVSFRDGSFLNQFLNSNLPSRLGTAFREIILDYYQCLARSQDRKYPMFFAEKTLPEPDARFGVRFLFRHTREVVVIRDLRDVLCSFMRYSSVTFDEALSDMVSAAARFREIKAEPDGNAHFLRYEDFVLNSQETLARLFGFLGISSVKPDQAAMGQLFGRHATSRSPQESIGRWRRDLSREQLDQCRVLAPFLEEFGYEPLA